MKNINREFWLIIFSFLIVYVVWGATYVANAWAVDAIPPFIMSGSRFIIAGSIMLGFISILKPIRITRKQLRNTAFAGFLLFAVGNGLVVWALQYVDSGLAALIVALEPLIVVVMLWVLRNQKPQWNSWIGTTLGLVGMFLLVGQPEFMSNTMWVFSVICIFIAISAWAYISIWLSTANLPQSVFVSSAFQMLFGGVFLLISASLTGEYARFEVDKIDLRTILSYAFLVLFGSIVAFTCFNYLLKKVSTTKVVTATYVNPVVALFLGWWLNHEKLSTQSLIASVLLVVGVIFINARFSKKAP